MPDSPNHRSDLHRLKRIQGQLDGIGRMIEEGRYCPDILVQTRAVTSAIRSLEKSLLGRHLAHCVSSAFEHGNAEDRQAKLDELLELFARRLEP